MEGGGGGGGGGGSGVNPAECMRVAQEIFPGLIDDTLSTKVFSAKWQMIRGKLDQLNRDLCSAADCPRWTKNSVMRDLLPDVVSTLREIGGLAKSCTELSYSGKLLMQSDLDVVVSRLNLHLRDLDLLLKSGVLQCSGGSPPSSPAADVVFFVKDLFTRLHIGNSEVKRNGLSSLVKVLDDEAVLQVVAKEGDIGYLVHLLDSNVGGVREQAVAAVAALAQACERGVFRDEGVVAPLVRLLDGGDGGDGRGFVVEKAAEALRGLTANPENAWAVAANDGLAALVRICQHGPDDLHKIAVDVLVNLCSVTEIRLSLAEEGAVPVLVNLVNSGPPPVRESAATCLHLLASEGDKVRRMIECQGGVEALVTFLESAENSSHSREMAFRAIHGLSASQTASMLLMLSPKFLKQLVSILGNGSPAIQNLGASTVCNLVQGEKTVELLGEAGCVAPLAKMLEGKQSSSQEIAAMALSRLFIGRSNRKEFVRHDENVARLVKLLDPGDERVNRKCLLLAIEALAESKSCRKKIALAGACEHLKKLVDMDVDGAKKVLHKIEGGHTLFKIISRKWRERD
uniref:TSA: Wollemia nobilis Ref_Wollemi_Transcript_13044_2567 transcribed RNA sequence n=1 Tax=Wollemia nobilis TaxID=56998 RepID=A0A0C9RKX7_9CONI